MNELPNLERGRGVMPVGSHDRAGVQRYFDRMAQSLTAGDGAAVARMWGVPALVLGDDAVHAIGTMQEVEKFFAGAKEQYNRLGIVDTRAEIISLDWITERIAIAEVSWPHLDASGARRGAERSTYILRSDAEGELELRVALMHGVTEGASPSAAVENQPPS